MKFQAFRKTAIFAVALCAALLPFTLRAQESHPPHWTYEGKENPKNWGKLDPSYSACSLGHTQSPINIKGAKKSDLPAIEFNYNAVPLSIVNNGHTIMVNYAPGSTITVAGKTYALKQFHFHHPSEEEINSKRFALDAHLVHADADGKLAVVAVLFKEGAANSFLDAIWKNIPAEKDKTVDVSSTSINAKDLLPSNHGYYTFQGSLTTPPCTEGVTWYVLRDPVSISAEQVAAFAKLYPKNNRPIQKTNAREVLESK